MFGALLFGAHIVPSLWTFTLFAVAGDLHFGAQTRSLLPVYVVLKEGENVVAGDLHFVWSAYCTLSVACAFLPNEDYLCMFGALFGALACVMLQS